MLFDRFENLLFMAGQNYEILLKHEHIVKINHGLWKFFTGHILNLKQIIVACLCHIGQKNMHWF